MPGAFAEELTRKTVTKTAWVEEGPFYPPKLPLDTDNDLLIVNDAITPAIGEVTHLSGRLLDASGGPVRNATIEIWCVDHDGVYLADRGGQSKFDANPQQFVPELADPATVDAQAVATRIVLRVNDFGQRLQRAPRACPIELTLALVVAA